LRLPPRRRTWPVVSCIGVLNYYPDPLPLLGKLSQYVEEQRKLIVTWPNALSPLGWLYFLVPGNCSHDPREFIGDEESF
jgi:hypothetical protein